MITARLYMIDKIDFKVLKELSKKAKKEKRVFNFILFGLVFFQTMENVEEVFLSIKIEY